MLYFKHDIGAFRDSKVQALRIECGGAAVDAYYAILELIYERETDLVLFGNQAETKSVSYWLCLDTETLEAYVRKMTEVGLLDAEEGDDGSLTLSSRRATEAIAEFQSRSETARQNGKKGGRPKGSKTKQKPKETDLVFLANQSETKQKTKEKEKEEYKKEVSKDTSKKPPKHRHGEYGNVLLTEDELAKLKERFPTDWEARIRNLDEYIGYKGAKYKSHYLTIINWANRDQRSGPRTYEEVGRERYGEYNRAAM